MNGKEQSLFKYINAQLEKHYCMLCYIPKKALSWQPVFKHKHELVGCVLG